MSETLGEYLRKSVEAGQIDHSLRATVDDHGAVTFVIHPASDNGEVLYCSVIDDAVRVRKAIG